MTEGRNRQPSAGIIDSQSVKSSEVSDERSYDAGKKINGRKRHILVDPIGLMLMVMGLPANIQDRDGAKQLLAAFFSQKTRRRVKHIWADGGYAGALLDWSRRVWRRTIEIVRRSELHPFKVLPRRWVVERTFGWFGCYRRTTARPSSPSAPGWHWKARCGWGRSCRGRSTEVRSAIAANRTAH
jgi:putative transposase